jgi:hypothetical protein
MLRLRFEPQNIFNRVVKHMATLQASLRTLAGLPTSLLELVGRLNQYVCAQNLGGRRFTTAFLAELEPATGRLTYVNAGHNWPVLRRSSGAIERLESLDELGQMEMYFESQWHRQPTPKQFQAMVEDRVREEVLYREALAMGLDKEDTIVKRRMAQKMQFLAEDVAAAHEPSTAELKEWFEKNSAKFALPSRYSFRHLYFSPDRRGRSGQAF